MVKSRIIAIRKENIALANQAFADLMAKTEHNLNILSKKRPHFFKNMSPVSLEEESCQVIKSVCSDTPFNPDNVVLISGHSFPDIVADNYYGVEVKCTKSDHWTSTGSSIVESTRVDTVESIYMLFGKLGGNPPLFKCRPYNEVLSDIAVTHSPRYLIDMELVKGETIFDKMNTTYDKFRRSKNNISLVRDYYKKKAKSENRQEMPWWITNDNAENPVSLNLRLWNSINAEEKKKLISYCLVLFPEIWSPAAIPKTKYNQACLWLCSYAQVVCPNLRDPFTAGGRIVSENGKKLKTSYDHIYKTIVEHSQTIKELLNNPSEDTKSLIKEFNPALLARGTYYKNWENQLLLSTKDLNLPLKKWLDKHPVLQCEK